MTKWLASSALVLAIGVLALKPLIANAQLPPVGLGTADSFAVLAGSGVKVFVTRADRLVAVFRVDGVRRYPKDLFPTRLVYGNTDHAALRLITCGGPFDSANGQYVDNIVVFASLVGFH